MLSYKAAINLGGNFLSGQNCVLFPHILLKSLTHKQDRNVSFKAYFSVLWNMVNFRQAKMKIDLLKLYTGFGCGNWLPSASLSEELRLHAYLKPEQNLFLWRN